MRRRSPTYISFEPRTYDKILFLSTLLTTTRQEVIRRALRAFEQTLTEKERVALDRFLEVERPNSASEITSNSEYLSYAQVCEATGLTPSQVAKYAHGGSFKKGPIRGKRPTISRSSVERYLNRKKGR